MRTQMKQIEVLLVEDDRIDREYLSRFFDADSRTSLTTANCLHDGIQLIRIHGFDAVVFDLGLPDSYGIDSIRRMFEEFPGLPVIVITGLNAPDLERQARKLGVSDFVVKGPDSGPLVLESVCEAVSQVDDNASVPE